MNADPRPCERQCRRCGQWLHFSRFRKREVRGSTYDGPRAVCKACEQIVRNEQKNADRPRAILRRRAGTAAQKAAVPLEFVWVSLNYRALVPVLRAMLSPEGLCSSCGHPFTDQRDVQLEHREPPRHPQDWARLHARNIGIACTSCNQTKQRIPYHAWLDAQETARIANTEGAPLTPLTQLTLELE